MAELRALFANGCVPESTGKGEPKESLDYPGYLYDVRVVDLQPKSKKPLGREYFIEVKVSSSG